MARFSKRTRIVFRTLLVSSVALVIAGALHAHRVHTVDADEWIGVLDVLPFEKISDHQLIVDSTFAGVIRRGDGLYSTYDRSLPARKRACPT